MPRQRILPRALSEPHPARLSESDPNREEIIRRHDLAMALGNQGYMDPATDNFVFTAKYLVELGSCCAMACRHCPYKR